MSQYYLFKCLCMHWASKPRQLLGHVMIITVFISCKSNLRLAIRWWTSTINTFIMSGLKHLHDEFPSPDSRAFVRVWTVKLTLKFCSIWCRSITKDINAVTLPPPRFTYSSLWYKWMFVLSNWSQNFCFPRRLLTESFTVSVIYIYFFLVKIACLIFEPIRIKRSAALWF